MPANDLRPAALGAGLALALTAIALCARGGAGAGVRAEPATRVVMIGVRGLSWTALSDGIVAGRLPALAELAEGRAVIGDLFAEGHTSEAEVLASVITGRFPFRHGIENQAELTRLRDRAGLELRTPWDWIADHGGRIGAFGFPFGRERNSADARVIPAARARGRPRRAVSAGTDPDPAMEQDRAVVQAALVALRDDPGRHVFVYLQGLKRCATASWAGEGRLEACYAELDSIVAELDAAAGPHTTFLLFSERGNPDGTMTWRPRFPRLEHAPPVGCFLAWGRAVSRRDDRPIVAPVDLAATALYLSGCPLPLDSDGTVLYGILDDGQAIERRLAFAR